MNGNTYELRADLTRMLRLPAQIHQVRAKIGAQQERLLNLIKSRTNLSRRPAYESAIVILDGAMATAKAKANELQDELAALLATQRRLCQSVITHMAVKGEYRCFWNDHTFTVRGGTLEIEFCPSIETMGKYRTDTDTSAWESQTDDVVQPIPVRKPVTHLVNAAGMTT